MARQTDHVERIKNMVSFIARIVVYPGEDELKSLAFNGLLALDGQIEIRDY
jgi:butyrate kinase